MRYVLFSLTVLFLTACGDTDNPVVSTAPAGKALQVQPSSTNQPSSRKLVGNRGRPSGSLRDFQRDRRQDFTTGLYNNWKLTAVLFDMSVSTTWEDFAVEIWTTDSDGMLDTRLGTLTFPTISLNSNAPNKFTGDIDLAANTTYALVVDAVPNAAAQHIRLRTANSGAEDGGAVAGWSIDEAYSRSDDQSEWEVASQPYKIEIHGYEKVLPQSEVDRHPVSPLPSADSGCTVTYYEDADGNLVDKDRAEEEGITKVTEPTECSWKKAWDTGEPSVRESIENRHRYEELVEDGVLPTISVSGCRDDNDAVFTFSRTGPPTENLTFSFYANGGDSKITTGFGAGSASFEWRRALDSDVSEWRLTIESAWHSAMTGDFMLGTSSASVNSSSGNCP